MLVRRFFARSSIFRNWDRLVTWIRETASPLFDCRIIVKSWTEFISPLKRDILPTLLNQHSMLVPLEPLSYPNPVILTTWSQVDGQWVNWVVCKQWNLSVMPWITCTSRLQIINQMFFSSVHTLYFAIFLPLSKAENSSKQNNSKC